MKFERDYKLTRILLVFVTIGSLLNVALVKDVIPEGIYNMVCNRTIIENFVLAEHIDPNVCTSLADIVRIVDQHIAGDIYQLCDNVVSSNPSLNIHIESACTNSTEMVGYLVTSVLACLNITFLIFWRERFQKSMFILWVIRLVIPMMFVLIPLISIAFTINTAEIVVTYNGLFSDEINQVIGYGIVLLAVGGIICQVIIHMIVAKDFFGIVISLFGFLDGLAAAIEIHQHDTPTLMKIHKMAVFIKMPFYFMFFGTLLILYHSYIIVCVFILMILWKVSESVGVRWLKYTTLSLLGAFGVGIIVITWFINHDLCSILVTFCVNLYIASVITKYSMLGYFEHKTTDTHASVELYPSIYRSYQDA